MNTNKPPLALACEARELAAGASAAPWTLARESTGEERVESNSRQVAHQCYSPADARFIARSRTLVVELAEAVEGLASENERLREALVDAEDVVASEIPESSRHKKVLDALRVLDAPCPKCDAAVGAACRATGGMDWPTPVHRERVEVRR